MEKIKVSLIVFYDNKKRILLQDREGISRFGEEWGFFGGKIEDGETKEQSLVRETKEELDFDLQNYEYIGKVKIYHHDHMSERFLFISSLDDNFSKFKLKEGKDMKIFTIKEARKLKMVVGDNSLLDILEKKLSNKKHL